VSGLFYLTWWRLPFSNIHWMRQQKKSLKCLFHKCHSKALATYAGNFVPLVRKGIWTRCLFGFFVVVCGAGAWTLELAQHSTTEMHPTPRSRVFWFCLYADVCLYVWYIYIYMIFSDDVAILNYRRFLFIYWSCFKNNQFFINEALSP
jgi:hypothetical protein